MMTAEQLKVSLYLLLFSGKLTEQLADDSTATELLKRIEKKHPASKKALRIIKKESGDYYEVAGTKETCISDELLFDIPDNWAWVHLNEIAVSGLGKTLNKSKDTGDTKQYLCSINVYWDGIHLDEIKEAKFSESDIEKYKLVKGDLLICEGGDAGRTAIWEFENEMYYQNALHRVRFWEGIDPYYFRALMEFYKLNGTIDSYCKGMTIKHLVQGALNAIRFPLPPLAEQKRIVAKIEELMPFVEQYAAASTKLNTLNTSFPEMMKKSILQEAVQGKLVPQDPNDEPASVLLKKIAEEKKRLIKEGKIKKQKPLPEITEDEIPFDIPDSWEWVRFTDIAETCLGKMLDRAKNKGDSHPYLRNVNVRWGQFDLSDLLEMRFDDDGERFLIRGGDMVVCEGGEPGRCAVWNSDNTIRFQKALHRIRFIGHNVEPLFYYYVLNLYSKNGYLSRFFTGTTIKHLPGDKLNKVLIPCPPQKEQLRIVLEIEKCVSALEMLEERIIA